MSSRPPVQTIQQTGKVWKAIIAVGTMITLVAGVALVVSIVVVSSAEDGAESAGVTLILSGLATVGGLMITLVGKLGRWWFHK